MRNKDKKTGSPFHSLVIKVFASLLFIVTSLVTVASTVGIVLMSEEGYYSGNLVPLDESGLVNGWMYDDARDVFNTYVYWYIQPEGTRDKGYNLAAFKKMYSADKTNFIFKVLDEENQLVLTNTENPDTSIPESRYIVHTCFFANGEFFFYYGEDYQYYTDNGFYYIQNGIIYFVDEYESSIVEVSNLELKEYSLFYALADPISADDRYSLPAKFYEEAFLYRYDAIILCLISFVIAVLLFIYLMCSAGHRRQSDEIRPNLQDKIPYDIYLGIIVGMVALIILCTSEILESASLNTLPVNGLLILLCGTVVIFLLLALCMTTASRLKLGKMYRNTFVFFCLMLFIKMNRKFFGTIKRIFYKLPSLWKTILLFGLAAMCNFIITVMLTGGYGGLAAFFWLLFHILILTLLCIYTSQMNDLKKGAERIAAGDTEYKIPTNSMFSSVKHCSEELNCIGTGISKAVEEKMKSEHLKTELITNVSHDIKTPLTSIINYIDLIKREEIENEKVKEYLEILERQSSKLKKLTEDVVEASKASTGNIPVELMPINVTEIINQTIGEYSERLDQCNLRPIVNSPEEPCFVMGDGKLLWRVIDNLLSNVCKYSQDNTRIYFDIFNDGMKVHIIVKNVSKDVLNISADELMERFTRGDRARSTEGSGLGLSIAKSLTELQKGEFSLSLDGDLFKAEIILPQVAKEV